MSLISFEFLAFLAVLFLCYFLIPGKWQWKVLLCANIVFYLWAGIKYFVETLERCLIKAGVIDKAADKEFLPMQPGDVYQTYADVKDLVRDFGFKPKTSLEEGLTKFAEWYAEYYEIK